MKKTRRGTRPKNKEQEILDVATEYFLAHGYAGTSISEMARESGISKESIYRYFDSKEALFWSVIDRELEGYQAKLRADVPDSADLKGALQIVAETVGSTLNSDRALALRRLIFQQATVAPDLGRHYFDVGPMQADKVLDDLFADHQEETAFATTHLTQYFIAMVGHRLVLERECRTRRLLTKAQVKKQSTRIVDDFLQAFFNR